MKKLPILIALVFLLSGYANNPIYANNTVHAPIYANMKNMWNPSYDGYHDCIREWWNVDAFIKTDKNYSITASFEYEKETPAANLFFTIFDWDEGKVYDLGSYGDNISALKCVGKYSVNISYGSSWMKGRYPFYKVHFENKGIVVEMELIAESRAKFVAEGEGGILPMGFGYYRYLFIPKCIVKGQIFIDGNVENFKGVAYYEHVWGNWSYHNPLRGVTAKPYLMLARWWWEHKNITWDTITVSTNNPFGYDWAWGAFSNGWSIFYGAVPFWIGEIPFGVLYLFRDGEVMEFGGISYRYLDGVFYHGFYIPTTIKITAEGAGTLSLILKMNHAPHIYEDELDSPYWDRLILYESPGYVAGTYLDEEGHTTPLAGFCEVEIERQGSIFQYLMVQLSHHATVFELLFISCLLDIIFEVELSLNPFSIHFSFSHIGEHNTEG